MDRRTLSFVLGAGALAGALPVLRAQPRQARVAWVTLARTDPNSAFLETFRARLRELGWVEGRSLTIEPWGADGSGARLKELVPQIVASRADVIVATGGPTVRYFVDVPVPQPVAFSSSADAVIGGLVNSMAQPGVNRTGVTFFSLELAPKRLAMMKELLPGMKQVAIVGWPPHAGENLELQVAGEAAATLGLAHSYHGVTTGDELDAALRTIERSRADAVLVFAGTIASQFPDRFAAFSMRTRRPAVSAWAAFAEAGNVMSYGPILRESFATLAEIVDRLLRGAKAAETPVQAPTRIEMVLNLKTASAIGLRVPPAALHRADRVIE
jgi:putative ABC transport system substrate-binding protein